MKIILATPDQFRAIWEKSIPSQRDGGGVPHPVIIMRHLDAMIVLHEDVKIGSIEAFNEPLTLQWLNETILNNRFLEVG
jgi:hypothetical protein